MLKVVRFRGTSTREYHALAFCIPTETLVRVIYAEYEIYCEAHQLIKAVDVNVQSMMDKAHVLAAIDADYSALREKLPEYGQARICRGSHMCATLCATSGVTHCAAFCGAPAALCRLRRAYCAGARIARGDATCSPLA
jgi:hypothetical protein